MATVNIYVSDELKARMGQHDLKWSQIASSAIETAINLEERKAVNMEAASIERLRASRAEAAEQRHADGVRDGKRWALEHAEFEELERVARLVDDPAWQSEDDQGACAHMLARAILDDEPSRQEDISECIESLFGRAAPTVSEMEGFVEGAADIHAEV